MFLSTSFIRLIPAVALVGVDSSLERKKKQNAKQLRKVVDPQSANQIQRSRDRIKRFMVERGVPGLSVGVTVNGKFVWKEGFGYADVENLTPCHGDTLMRIASISKPITTLLAAKCLQEGKLDLDKPVQHYVPEFPEKQFEGEKVTITPRHLLSHMSGIRHYEKKLKEMTTEKADENNKDLCSKCKQELRSSEFVLQEYFNTREYQTVTDALNMFKDDLLLAKPGSKYIYSTHGFTLLSAVIEKAAGRKFSDLLRDLFRQLGMSNTFLDENRPVIASRAKYYQRTKKLHRLVNVPEVNNSYKWAGGGILSNVTDLLRFANCLLTSAQFDEICLKPTDKIGLDCCNSPPFLQSEAVKQLWTPVITDDSFYNQIGPKAYGMGWVVHAGTEVLAGVANQPEFYSHSGGAIGASSILVICPSPIGGDRLRALPSGVAVVILANLQECGMTQLGYEVAREFLPNFP